MLKFVTGIFSLEIVLVKDVKKNNTLGNLDCVSFFVYLWHNIRVGIYCVQSKTVSTFQTGNCEDC